MFIKLVVVTNKREQETYIVKTKILGFGVSNELGLTYILSDTGHALVIKESLDELKTLLNSVDKQI